MATSQGFGAAGKDLAGAARFGGSGASQAVLANQAHRLKLEQQQALFEEISKAFPGDAKAVEKIVAAIEVQNAAPNPDAIPKSTKQQRLIQAVEQASAASGLTSPISKTIKQIGPNFQFGLNNPQSNDLRQPFAPSNRTSPEQIAEELIGNRRGPAGDRLGGVAIEDATPPTVGRFSSDISTRPPVTATNVPAVAPAPQQQQAPAPQQQQAPAQRGGGNFGQFVQQVRASGMNAAQQRALLKAAIQLPAEQFKQVKSLLLPAPKGGDKLLEEGDPGYVEGLAVVRKADGTLKNLGNLPVGKDKSKFKTLTPQEVKDAGFPKGTIVQKDEETDKLFVTHKVGKENVVTTIEPMSDADKKKFGFETTDVVSKEVDDKGNITDIHKFTKDGKSRVRLKAVQDADGNEMFVTEKQIEDDLASVKKGNAATIFPKSGGGSGTTKGVMRLLDENGNVLPKPVAEFATNEGILAANTKHPRTLIPVNPSKRIILNKDGGFTFEEGVNLPTASESKNKAAMQSLVTGIQKTTRMVEIINTREEGSIIQSLNRKFGVLGALVDFGNDVLEVFGIDRTFSGTEISEFNAVRETLINNFADTLHSIDSSRSTKNIQDDLREQIPEAGELLSGEATTKIKLWNTMFGMIEKVVNGANITQLPEEERVILGKRLGLSFTEVRDIAKLPGANKATMREIMKTFFPDELRLLAEKKLGRKKKVQ